MLEFAEVMMTHREITFFPFVPIFDLMKEAQTFTTILKRIL